MITIEHKSDLTHFEKLNEKEPYVLGMLVSYIYEKDSIGMITNFHDNGCIDVLWSKISAIDPDVRYLQNKLYAALKIPREFLIGK